ncbi:MAG: hypothetical protein HXY26_08275 [Hydrogenophilaceae bacterium]|nr:hypothetical protein [Hydrogenophilaceae bacterium]
MLNVKAFTSLLAVIVLVGCAYPRAKSSVVQPVVIQPEQEITILWDIGNFDRFNVNDALVRNGTNTKHFEACTNHFFETTFARNGYKIKIIKVDNAQLGAVTASSPFVLVMHNVSAKYQLQSPQSVVLDYEGDLYDLRTGKIVWTAKNWLSMDPNSNGHSALQLIRAMAADGILVRRMEEIVDYEGVLSAQYRKLPGCPLDK